MGHGTFTSLLSNKKKKMLVFLYIYTSKRSIRIKIVHNKLKKTKFIFYKKIIYLM